VAYRRFLAPGQAPAAETIATAAVTRGDVVVSVSGSGTLKPAEEVDLAYKTEGYLDEVLVGVGDRVREGDVLARMKTAELELAVNEAQIALREAQLNLADVSEPTSEAELADARAALQSAQAGLRAAQHNYESAQNSQLDSVVRGRQIDFLWYVSNFHEAEQLKSTSQADLEEAWDGWANAEYAYNQVLQQAKMEDLSAANALDQAQNRVVQAAARLELMQTGQTTETIMRAELQVEQAQLNLDDARANLTAAELKAPFGGTIVAVNAVAGDKVGASPIVTLADLDTPLVLFWVEEADMSGVAVGRRIQIVFDALPDEQFYGEVVRVEPALVSVGNTLAVQAWASVDTTGRPATLLGGMNGDVEIISAESRDTILAPLTALRDLGDGLYAVFVVSSDGAMNLRVVEVGLQDLVNTEILSGLDVGETVSTGVAQAENVAIPEMQMGAPGGGVFMGGPGGGAPGGGPVIAR